MEGIKGSFGGSSRKRKPIDHTKAMSGRLNPRGDRDRTKLMLIGIVMSLGISENDTLEGGTSHSRNSLLALLEPVHELTMHVAPLVLPCACREIERSNHTQRD